MEKTPYNNITEFENYLMINNSILYNQPVVIDNGSGLIKAGFSGEDKPKCFEYSLVGDAKYDKVMVGGLASDRFVGNKAQELRGLLRLRYPIEHGVVTNWNDMELIWSHILHNSLQLQSVEEHPVSITEAPLNPRRNRDEMCQVLFEALDVPAVYVSNPAVLSLYASGRITGCVLDCGDGYCCSVPVYEGLTLSPSIRRMDIGGRDVTEQLQFQLRKETGMSLFSSSEREVVRTIKEKACYVAIDPKQEEEKFSFDAEKMGAKFKLPDGNSITVENSRFRAPELLFHPQIIGSECCGLPKMCLETVSKVDLDLRPSLLSSVILSGGTTMLPGFGERMLKELQILTQEKSNIRLLAPPERRFTTWIGGSILASLSTFQRILMSRSDWEEDHFRVHSQFM